MSKKANKFLMVYDGAVAPESPGAGVSYCRVSTPGQEEGTSLDTQLEGNLSLAASLGVPVAPDHIITEVWSAADPYRPGFVKVRRLVGDGVVQHVFVYDTDRLGRDPWHIVEFIRYCKERGVALHFADGTNVESVLDEALQYFKGPFGFQEREKIAQRTMEGKIKTAKLNRMPNRCGRGIFGYDYDRVTHTRTVNEAETLVVRQMNDWAVSGVSCNEICRRLNERGIRTKTGGEWDPRTVRNVLRNEAYTGAQWWGRYRYEMVNGGDDGKRQKRRVTPKPKEEWIRLEGFTPRIIDPGLFQAVQRVLHSHRRPPARWDYIFSEFFTRGECGSSVCGATQQKGRYPYYRCIGTLGNHRRPKICDLRSMRADKLEPVIQVHIRALVQDPTGIISDLRQASGDGGVDLDRRISGLKAQVKKCRLHEATLVMQRTKGLIDQDMLEMLIAPISNLRREHEREVELLVEQKKLNEKFHQLEGIIRSYFARYADAVAPLDSEGMQELMRLLDVRLVASPGRVMVTGVLDPSLFTTGQTLA